MGLWSSFGQSLTLNFDLAIRHALGEMLEGRSIYALAPASSAPLPGAGKAAAAHPMLGGPVSAERVANFYSS
jgi:hypothetical protein